MVNGRAQRHRKTAQNLQEKYGCARRPADCCGDSRVSLNRCWAAVNLYKSWLCCQTIGLHKVLCLVESIEEQRSARE